MPKHSIDLYVKRIIKALREAVPEMKIVSTIGPIWFENYGSPTGVFIECDWPLADEEWCERVWPVSDLLVDAHLDTGVPFFIFPLRAGLVAHDAQDYARTAI